MFGRIKAWIKKKATKIVSVATAAVMVIGQTENTTTTTPSFDYSALTNIVVAVIPLFVLIAVIKLLFKSFKDVA